jgi:hypothetical protein
MKLQSYSKELDSILRRSLLCPSCSILRLDPASDAPRKRRCIARYASTASSTAVNGRQVIPPQNEFLHEALTQVKNKASAHLNLSRLQLAIQGLESQRPTTRIAIIGLDVRDVARRIVRLLLADPLEDVQSWEKQIVEAEDFQDVLLRHGRSSMGQSQRPATMHTLYIPSSLLENLNLEILITSVNSEHGQSAEVPTEAFLSPAVGVPTAFDGRRVTVNQPVHHSLLVAQGFEELVASIELLAATRFETKEDEEAVTLVANLAGSNAQSQTRVLTSDIARAEKGLEAIRQSTSKATTYEHEWLGSGMPILTKWLEKDISEREHVPPLIVTRLITSLLTSASRSIETNALALRQKSLQSALSVIERSRIETAIDDFSRAAHVELQSGLASAWSSRNWRKLSWYKLFWRVDDVGLIISDLVTNSWLPRTERAIYELSGRLIQLGVSPMMPDLEVPQLEHSTAFEPDATRATILDPAPPVLAAAASNVANEVALPMSRPVLTTNNAVRDGIEVKIQPVPIPVPITSSISSARTGYMRTQITDLTSTAQQLVFRTLSISGMSAGLSALTCVSELAPTLYEAGSLFAVGTVFALYRMQSGWQTATKALERGLFEEGRDVIRRVTQRMRELVEKRAEEVAAGDPVEQQMLEEAAGAVEKAKKALEEVQKAQAP